MEHISPVEVVLHRVIWAVPVAMIVLFAMGRTADIIPTFKNPKALALLFVSSAVITLNWGLFVWAITEGRALESALGYYINPLVTIAIAAIFLGEKLQPLQMTAIGFAVVAVVILTVLTGDFPWISLVLALSFATYGFIRKVVEVGPSQGFLIEVLLLSLFAIPILAVMMGRGTATFATNSYDTWLLLGCGPITAIPLILYAFGAKGLRLSTLGIMQYIAPTGIFIIGVFVFKEPFSQWQLFAFVLIWIGLALYSWSAISTARKSRKSQPPVTSSR